MFVVYARSFGGPRRPLGHFAGLKAAQAYADAANATMPTDELVVVEQPDGNRKNFADRPEEATAEGGDGIDATIPVELTAKGGKK
jgi:hypothetical protein